MTLGWEILGWTAEYAEQPDGPNAGDPWKFTKEQVLHLLNWYAIDGNGQFVYRYGTLRRMKGWGKDPYCAVLCFVEMVGPCRFGGWDNGQPIVIPHPAAWIQIAAVSREQTRNTMTLFPGIISRRAIEEYSIDIGKEIIYAENGRKRIEAVTSSPRALEGGRITFTVKGETQHWLGPNEGHEMAKVIARNAAKSRDSSSRVLANTNAHAPGENSDAEHDYETWKKVDGGLSEIKDFLYDSLEAPEDIVYGDDESLRSGILAARGDSEWLNPDRLIAECRDPRTTEATGIRFYLNRINAEEDKPFDKARFIELERKGYEVKGGEWITLGFDGSINRDHTALIGTEILTGHQWLLGCWEPEIDQLGEIKIPRDEVDETVEDAFKRWNVWRMYADPFGWKDYLSKWAGKQGADKIIEVPNNQPRRMAMVCANYRVAIQEGLLSHDGDKRFNEAIGNAHKHMLTMRDDKGELMWFIQKERPDSPLKIDAATAGALSWQARTDAVALGVGAKMVSVYETRGVLVT